MTEYTLIWIGLLYWSARAENMWRARPKRLAREFDLPTI